MNLLDVPPETTTNEQVKKQDKIIEKLENETKEEKTLDMGKVKEFQKLLKNKYNNDVSFYIKDISRYMIVDEENNILKQVLIHLATIILKKGFFNQIQATTDKGKSYIKKTGLKFIPDEKIQKANSYTRASFLMEAETNPYCFDGIIIDMEDLGNIEELEKATGGIFEIVKSLITENSYTDRKGKKDKQGNWKASKTTIKGTPNLTFTTVEPLSNSKKNQQLDNRTITTTPLTHTREKKLRFQNKRERLFTDQNKQYKNKIQELELFKEYIRFLIQEKDKYILDIVFYETLDDFTLESLTDTRQNKAIKDLFELYIYLNKERCYSFTVENLTYLMPCLKDLENFINLMIGDIGLKKYEKDVILSLKEYMQITSENKINDIVNQVYEDIETANAYDREYRIEQKTSKGIIQEYGLNKNRGQQKLKETETYFLTESKFKEKYRGKELNEIKENAGSVTELFNKLYDLEFLEKIELEYRNKPIYYLTPKIQEINLNYKIKEKTINCDIKELETLKTEDNKKLLNDKMIKKYRQKFVHIDKNLY